MGFLAPFTSELDRIAPSFDIHGSQIHIIRSPADFYETLKVRRLENSPLLGAAILRRRV